SHAIGCRAGSDGGAALQLARQRVVDDESEQATRQARRSTRQLPRAETDGQSDLERRRADAGTRRGNSLAAARPRELATARMLDSARRARQLSVPRRAGRFQRQSSRRSSAPFSVRNRYTTPPLSSTASSLNVSSADVFAAVSARPSGRPSKGSRHS